MIMENENALMATSIVVDKNWGIKIRGYYRNDKPKVTRYIQYDKDIDGLYQDILEKNIIIQDTANSYKWNYILWNIFQTPKEHKQDMFKTLVKRYIVDVIKGKLADKYYIKMNNSFVESTDRKKIYFTDNIDNARKYNYFTAAFLLRLLNRKDSGNIVRIIHTSVVNG